MNTNVKKIKEQAMQFFTEGSELIESIDEFKEWNSLSDIQRNIPKVSELASNLLLAVDVVVADLDADLKDFKTEEGLDAAALMLDEIIKLPLYLEWLDGPVIKIILALVRDLLTERLGEDFDLSEARATLQAGKKYIDRLNG